MSPRPLPWLAVGRVGCGGPIGMLPGGALRGEPEGFPPDRFVSRRDPRQP